MKEEKRVSQNISVLLNSFLIKMVVSNVMRELRKELAKPEYDEMEFYLKEFNLRK